MADKYSKLNSLLRGFADSATLGFGDEIVGGIKAAKDALTTDKKLSDAYTEYRDKYRQASKDMETENPKSFLTGEIAGGLATMALPGSAVRAPSMAKAALTGAGYGALTGAGKSEAQDVSDLIKDTSKGAAIGAAVAPVAQVAGQGFGALRKAIGAPTEEVAERLLSVAGQRKSAMAIGPEIEELAGALRNNRIAGTKSPDELMASYRRSQADKLLLPSDKAAEDMIRGAEARAKLLRDMPEEVTQATPETINIDDETLTNLLRKVK